MPPRKEHAIAVEHARLLRLLAAQGELLASTPESRLGELVPAVPGWKVEDALRHTGHVHRWVTSILRTGPNAKLGPLYKALPPSSTGPAALADYRTSLDALLVEFDKLDPAEPATTSVGPRTVGWWIRRQAHEVVVHRHDAESAYTTPRSVEPLIAADGVDEWVEVFVPRVALRDRKPIPGTLIGKSLALVASDVPGARWVVNADGNLTGGPSVEAPADATITLPAWELLLTVWRRLPIDPQALAGDVGVARAIYDFVRI